MAALDFIRRAPPAEQLRTVERVMKISRPKLAKTTPPSCEHAVTPITSRPHYRAQSYYE